MLNQAGGDRQILAKQLGISTHQLSYVTPVSYTHLDVYKRQVEIWKRFRKWGGSPTGITQNVKDLLSSREVENIFENSDFVYTVSYTHLDVYKRQALYGPLAYKADNRKKK